MKTVLRVFFTRFHQEDTNSSKYKRDRTFEDFPADVTPEAAKAELEAKHGKSTDSNLWDNKLGCQIAPHSFIVIDSHSMVDLGRKKVVLPSEKATEVPLFDGLTPKACLQDSPNMIMKRAKKRNKNGDPF